MMKPNRFRLDAHTIFLLVTLVGAGSLFVTTLTSEAPETHAEEVAQEVPVAEQPAAASEGHAPENAEAAAPIATAPETAKSSQSAANKPAACLTGEASIQDLQELKRQLAKKESELKKREEEIVAKEQALSEELKRIDAVRDEIKVAQVAGDAKSEEKLAKLVETLETMSPKAAAPIVSAVDEKLAVEAMSRLSAAKLGKILAAMAPEKSATLTEKLAGVVRVKMSSSKRAPASSDAAETTNRVKGGEENGNRKQSSNDAVDSRQPEPALGK